MTVAQIIDDAMTICNHATTVTATRTRFLRYVNQWHRRLLTRPGFMRLLRDLEQSITSVANQPVYGLSFPAGRLNGVHDPTNKRPLILRDLQWLRMVDSGLTASGTPTVYIPRGWFPVAQHPAAATGIFAVSDGTDSRTILGEFLLSDGTRRTVQAGLLDTTPVQFGSLTTVVQILQLTPSGISFPRTITIRATSGVGPILGVIQPNELVPRYFQIQLWPTPSGVLPFTLDLTREMVDLTEGDVPLLPLDFHFVLSLGCQAEEFRKFDDDRWQAIRGDLDEAIIHLNAWLWDLPAMDVYDNVRPGGIGFSRLGGFFPAGT